MARYSGPVCRICRRLGDKLYLKGEKCFTPKCPFERRPYPPGPRSTRRRKVSDRGLQLREKQRARAIYGILERQFRNYYEMAVKEWTRMKKNGSQECRNCHHFDAMEGEKQTEQTRICFPWSERSSETCSCRWC